MECACSCSYDYETGECFSEKMVKARKSHACCECDATIEVGELHEVAKGKWGEEWESFRTCLPCLRLRDDICPDNHVFGELREVVMECWGVDYVDGFQEDDDLGDDG